MTKRKNQETGVSFDTSTLRKWFEASKTHRVVVSKSDGSEMFNVTLLVAAIGVLVLFLTEGKVALIRPEETANDDVEPVNA
jgi:hypothetical protein